MLLEVTGTFITRMIHICPNSPDCIHSLCAVLLYISYTSIEADRGKKGSPNHFREERNAEPSVTREAQKVSNSR